MTTRDAHADHDASRSQYRLTTDDAPVVRDPPIDERRLPAIPERLSGTLRVHLGDRTSSGQLVEVNGEWEVQRAGAPAGPVELWGIFDLRLGRVRLEGVLHGEHLADAATPAADAPLALATRQHLTDRERETARLLALGESNVAIADRLGVSRHTARHHTEKVMEKLGVHSRAAVGAVLRGDVDVSRGHCTEPNVSGRVER